MSGVKCGNCGREIDSDVASFLGMTQPDQLKDFKCKPCKLRNSLIGDDASKSEAQYFSAKTSRRTPEMAEIGNLLQEIIMSATDEQYVRAQELLTTLTNDYGSSGAISLASMAMDIFWCRPSCGCTVHSEEYNPRWAMWGIHRGHPWLINDLIILNHHSEEYSDMILEAHQVFLTWPKQDFMQWLHDVDGKFFADKANEDDDIPSLVLIAQLLGALYLKKSEAFQMAVEGACLLDEDGVLCTHGNDDELEHDCNGGQ